MNFSNSNSTGAYKKTTTSERTSITTTEVRNYISSSTSRRSIEKISSHQKIIESGLTKSSTTVSFGTRPNFKTSASAPTFSNEKEISTIMSSLLSKNNGSRKLSEDSSTRMPLRNNPFETEFGVPTIGSKQEKTPMNKRPSTSRSYSTATSLSNKEESKPSTSSQLNIPFLSTPKTERFQTSRRSSKGSSGICYIFNHETFDNSENSERIGSQCDVARIKATFKKFKITVKEVKDLTVKGLKNEIKKIQKKDFSKNSSIIIVILSHGNRFETIQAKDGVYSIDDDILFPLLTNPTLENKPKIFFVQACKGEIDPRMYQTDSYKKPLCSPSEILKCYATFEGFVAYRDDKGSVFIQTICDLIEKHGNEKSIKEIMSITINEVKRRTGGKQVPSLNSTLTEPYILGN